MPAASEISRASLRRMIEKYLRTSSDLDAFLLDHFPSVYQRLSAGMDRTSRVNLLLELVSSAEVLLALEGHLNLQDRSQLLEMVAAQVGSDQPTKTASETNVLPLVFLEYAKEDQPLADELLRQLAPLKTKKLLRTFSRQDIRPGDNLQQTIEAQLQQAAVIVPFISSDLLAEEGFESFMRQAHRLSREGRAVIPLLARPALWEQTPLGLLQPVPTDRRPLSARSRADREEAFVEIARALSNAAEAATRPQEPTVKPAEPREPQHGLTLPAHGPIIQVEPARPRYKLTDIFPRTAGRLPKHNLVEPDEVFKIRNHLRDLGLGLIVEGPSGIGKTTAVKRAFELLTEERGSKVRPCTWIKGRDPNDQKLLSMLLEKGSFVGHLVIDDFHRLPAGMRARVADLIKVVADSEDQDAKVTVIGINPIGSSLLSSGTDLKGRYAKESLRKQPDHKVRDLIERGELAANIRFEHKELLVNGAHGCFFIAQLLCFYTAEKDGITETWPLPQPKVVSITPEYAIDRVQQQLDDSFREPLRDFASFSCPPAHGPRGATLALLYLLHTSYKESANESLRGTTSLAAAESRFPNLGPCLRWLADDDRLAARFEEQETDTAAAKQKKATLKEVLFYNAGIVSAEDPQLFYYLERLNWSAFIRDTGHDAAMVTWSSDKGLLFRYDMPKISVVMHPSEEAELLLPALDLPPSFFLHLSDLHFLSARQVTPFIDTLEADLLELRKLVPLLDGVVLSGDMTQVADRAEFAAAEDFVREMRSIYKLGPQQVILVPGNHDGSWACSRAAYPDPPIPNAKPDEVQYKKRFEAFADFYQAICGQPYPLDFERQATLYPFPASKVVFLGLNSAWQCDHLPENRGRATINEVALSSALRTIRREPTYADWLKIAVWHHPVQSDGEDRIKNTGFLDRLAQAGFRLGMHGHMHSAQIAQHAYDVTANGRKLRLLGAGTFGAPTDNWRDGVPLQYQILCIQKARVKVLSRCRDNPEGPWRGDGRWVVGADARTYYEVDL